jgi:hypothetical protein
LLGKDAKKELERIDLNVSIVELSTNGSIGHRKAGNMSGTQKTLLDLVDECDEFVRSLQVVVVLMLIHIVFHTTRSHQQSTTSSPPTTTSFVSLESMASIWDTSQHPLQSRFRLEGYGS